eukprot:GEZU01020382.1.p1 GENE.GEZU01020382.1~~GEZU01020382.1.p1  ORF type:complete len:185 (+),score=37.63 GEZU01020382.1:169-723(+)
MAPPPPPSRFSYGIYIWTWDPNAHKTAFSNLGETVFDIEDDRQVQELVDNVALDTSHPIDIFLVSIWKQGYGMYDDHVLSKFITKLHSLDRNKKIFALMTENIADRVVAYNQRVANQFERFDGIAFDYENLNRNNPGEFLSHFVEVERTAHSNGLLVHFSMGHWWESIQWKGKPAPHGASDGLG